jgi:hypothetical protein
MARQHKPQDNSNQPKTPRAAKRPGPMGTKQRQPADSGSSGSALRGTPDPSTAKADRSATPPLRSGGMVPRSLARADITPRGRARDEDIRKRAYEIFLRRGGAAGDPVADWLQAELELRGEHGRTFRA